MNEQGRAASRGRVVNGKHEECDIESTCLYPLLKSSDIANGRTSPDKFVLLTQKKPSDDTSTVRTAAPKTWDYLARHAEILDKRKSIIYAKRSRFSVFGIGDYTFAPWKVAISGLYKTCRFEAVGQFRGKPMVFDDTCYFIPCKSEDETRFMCELLNSDICQRFLRSLVFFDSKRPTKIDILNRIDLMRVAEKLNKSDHAHEYLTHAGAFEDRQPQLVFDGRATYRTTPSKRRRPRD